jgi:hypothetical protein
MTLSEFQRLLNTWGSDLRRWPEGERERAAALLRDSAAARELSAEEQQLDHALDAQPLTIEPEASARALRRVLRSELDRLPEQVGFWGATFSFGWVRAGAFAVVAGLAIALGWVVSEAGDVQGSSDDVASLLMRDAPGIGP